MSSLVRQSKLRHVFGEPKQPNQTISGLNPSSGTPEGNGLAGNAKFIAYSQTGGGGSLAVLPHDKPARLSGVPKLIKGHVGTILDCDFNPFDDYQVATASEDSTVKVWQIPTEGLTADVTDPIAVLEGHQKKTHVVLYNRVASNVVATASYDNSVRVWDLTAGKATTSFDNLSEDTLWSLSWNWTGSQLVTASRDRNIRILDPRSNTVASTFEGQDGTKPSKALWCGALDRILSIGFNRQSMRSVLMFDPRDTSKALYEHKLEVAPGVLMTMFDEDLSLLYLAGKGEISVRYFEVTSSDLFPLSVYSSTKPQRSACLLPKMACDLSKNEIGRIIRGLGDTLDIVPMIVPRRATEFQEDLYPDTLAPTPAMTADEWLAGKTSPPVLMPCRPGTQASVDAAQTPRAKTVFQLQKEVEEKDAIIADLQKQIAALKAGK